MNNRDGVGRQLAADSGHQEPSFLTESFDDTGDLRMNRFRGNMREHRPRQELLQHESPNAAGDNGCKQDHERRGQRAPQLPPRMQYDERSRQQP